MAIPVYDSQKVQGQVAEGARLNPAAGSTEGLQAVARGMGQVADAMQQVEFEASKQAASEKMVEFLKAKNTEEAQLGQITGEAAVKLDADGKTAGQRSAERLAALRGQLKEGLDFRTGKVFDAMSDSHMVNFDAFAKKHEAQQTSVWITRKDADYQSELLKSAMMNPAGEATSGNLAWDVYANAIDSAKFLGLSQADAEAYAKGQVSKFVAELVPIIHGKAGTQATKDYADGWRSYLTADAIGAIDKFLKPQGDYDQAVSLVSSVMGKVFDGKKSEGEMFADIDAKTDLPAQVREKAKQLISERVNAWSKDDKRRLDNASQKHWKAFNANESFSDVQQSILSDISLNDDEQGKLIEEFRRLYKARKDANEDSDEWRRNAMWLLMNPKELADKTPAQIMALELKLGPRWHSMVVNEYRNLNKDGDVSISGELVREAITKSGKKGKEKDEDVLLAVEATRAWANAQTKKPDTTQVMAKLIENMTPIEVEGRFWGTNSVRRGAIAQKAPDKPVVAMPGVSAENLALIRFSYQDAGKQVPTDLATLQKASSLLDKEPETKKALKLKMGGGAPKAPSPTPATPAAPAPAPAAPSNKAGSVLDVFKPSFYTAPQGDLGREEAPYVKAEREARQKAEEKAQIKASVKKALERSGATKAQIEAKLKEFD